MTSSGRQPVGLLIAIVVLFVGVGLSEHALAYVDLGSGSYMLQLFAAGFFGMIFGAKSLLARLRSKSLRRHGR